MNKWRIIYSEPNNAAMNMAIDEALLTLSNNVLRIYSWEPKAVSIGIFQSLNKEVDMKKIKENNYDVVRRYTGGGAVFHDQEITYSVVMSEIKGTILDSYKEICNALIIALKKIDIDSNFAGVNDIVVNNQKISGNAQTRKNGKILQHGTILVDVNVKKMFSLLIVPNEKIRDKSIKEVEKRVTSVKKLGKNPENLKKYIQQGFEEHFNIRFEESVLTKEEEELAKKLYDEKYSKKEWTELR